MLSQKKKKEKKRKEKIIIRYHHMPIMTLPCAGEGCEVDYFM
jgi:hypothetical protein